MRIRKKALTLLSIGALSLQQANGQESYDVEIWADPSELILGSSTMLALKICPSPSTDQGREVKSNAQIITDPGSEILVNYLVTGPNGSMTMHQSIQPSICESNLALVGLQPDMVGTWSIHAEAKWVSQGSIHEVRSEAISVIVKEPLFTGKLEKILDIERVPELLGSDPHKVEESSPRADFEISFRYFDWSEKGNLITFTTYSGIEPYSLWLMSSNGSELEKISLQAKFDGINFPKISPYEDSIIFVGNYFPANEPEEMHTDLFKYEIAEGRLYQITRTQFTNMTLQWVASFDWMPDGNIVYVETFVKRDTGRHDFQVWLADSDGNKIRKLLSRNIETSIGDVSPDGSKILFTSGRIFYVDGGELDGVLSFLLDRGGYNAKWNNNGELLVYSQIGTYGLGGTIYLTSTDGTYDQILYAGTPKPVDPAISPDGRFLVFGSPIATRDKHEDAGIYIMELSRPIPEFQVGVMIVPIAVGLMLALMRFARMMHTRKGVCHTISSRENCE
jgi:hypothetical protein